MPTYRNEAGQDISEAEFNRLQQEISAGGGYGNVRWTGTGYVSNRTPVSGGTAPTGTSTGVPTPTGGQGAFGLVPGATTTVDPQQLYNTIYPNLSQDVATASANNAALLRGEIPDDVARNVWDRRAAQSAAGGVSGSQFGGANTARDLGLTRLDLQNQGQTNFRNLLGTIYPVVGQTLENTRANADLAAAPDPAAAAAEQQRVFQQQQQNAFNNQQALLLRQFQQQQQLINPRAGGSPTPWNSQERPSGSYLDIGGYKSWL